MSRFSRKFKYVRHNLVQAVTSLPYLLADKGLISGPNQRKIAAYKNKHRGERCFIIGNGPSLNQLDMTLLQGEKTFGVNAIYLNYKKMGFYPTYYVVEDIFVAEDRQEEINAYQESDKFFGNYLKYCLTPSPRTTWMNIVLNMRYKDFPRFSTNAGRRMYVGGTVSFLCLQLAYYMGFSEVYLIGFDHNYIIPDSVKLSGTTLESTEADPNHFDPNYFGKGKRWHDPKVERMEESYRKAKFAYEADGRRIYNATAGGHLEVFDRVDYAGLLSTTEKTPRG